MRERKIGTITYPLLFQMISAIDGRTPLGGVSPVVSLSRDGAPFAAAAGTVTDLSIAPPSGLAVGSPASAGGNLVQSTAYYWVVTALNIAGETIASNEVTLTIGATGTSTNEVVLTWSAVTGATGYNVYRGTASGLEFLVATMGQVLTYTDVAAAPSTTAEIQPPLANATGGGWFALGGSGLVTDLNALGPLILHAVGAGADPIDVLFAVVPYDPFADPYVLFDFGTVLASPAPTATTFSSSSATLTATVSNASVGSNVIFQTAAQIGRAHRTVTAHSITAGSPPIQNYTITTTTGVTPLVGPSPGDTFLLG